MKSQSLAELDFILLSGRSHAPEVRPWLERTYQMWSNVWTNAMKELEGEERHPSDDFSRHDYLGVLTRAGQPIASVSFSRADLTLASWRADSYFKVWPEELLLEIARCFPGPRVMIGCLFTIDPAYRRTSLDKRAGFSVKQLMMELVLQELLSSPCGAMVGTMRADRGMHQLAYDSSALSLVRDRKHHGVAVDLVLWTRERLLDPALTRPCEEAAREIFERRLDLREATPAERRIAKVSRLRAA